MFENLIKKKIAGHILKIYKKKIPWTRTKAALNRKRVKGM